MLNAPQVEDRSQDLSKVNKDWSEDEFSKKTSENASSQASAGRKMDPDGPEVKGVKAEKMVVKAKQHVCDFPGCNLTFSRPSRLNNHMRIHTGAFPSLSLLCPFSFYLIFCLSLSLSLCRSHDSYIIWKLRNRCAPKE